MGFQYTNINFHSLGIIPQSAIAKIDSEKINIPSCKFIEDKFFHILATSKVSSFPLTPILKKKISLFQQILQALFCIFHLLVSYPLIYSYLHKAISYFIISKINHDYSVRSCSYTIPFSLLPSLLLLTTIPLLFLLYLELALESQNLPSEMTVSLGFTRSTKSE